MAPVEEPSDKPDGSEPLVTLQVIGGVPPLVWMFWLYAVPTVPFGNDVVVMLNIGLTVMLRAWVLVCGGVSESVAVTVKFVVPAVVGVPEIVPELLNVNPPGKLPMVTLQVIVPTPPALCSVAL
jgi:hypothetical protein